MLWVTSHAALGTSKGTKRRAFHSNDVMNGVIVEIVSGARFRQHSYPELCVNWLRSAKPSSAHETAQYISQLLPGVYRELSVL